MNTNEYGTPPVEAEFGTPIGADCRNPNPELEFSERTAPPREKQAVTKRRKRIRLFLFSAAALILLWLMAVEGGPGRMEPPVLLPHLPVTTEPAATPALTPALTEIPAASLPPEETPAPGETPAPTEEPPVMTKEPDVRPVFYAFSHEHKGFIELDNTNFVHSVYAAVKETELDKVVWEAYLENEDYADGRFELPVQSTGDYYMENREELDEIGAWPDFLLIVRVWYEDESGNEEMKELVTEPEWELGFGVSYWEPGYDWDEQIPPDSFLIMPWDAVEEISFVLNDPEAVTSPLIVSFDVSCGGRHLAADEYEEIVRVEEYDAYVDGSTELSHLVFRTKVVVIRRPDWMPESGTIHVVITQRLACTGELYTREFDYSYPTVYDFDS